MLLAMFAAVYLFANARVAAAQDASPRLHALLIGCGKYDSIKSLNGPDNDVAMTAETLAAPPYSIPKARLKTLSSTAAAESLPKSVKPGDQVFLLMAGHGTQVENDNPEDDWEPDGFDEVFLPVDASFESAAESGLRDDLIGELLDELRAEGVFVFLVVDSCFSGTMSRGPIADAMQLTIRCVSGPKKKQVSAATERSVLDLGSDTTDLPPGTIPVFKLVDLPSDLQPRKVAGV